MAGEEPTSSGQLAPCQGCGGSFIKRTRGRDANRFCSRACAVLHSGTGRPRKWATKAEAKRAAKAREKAKRRQMLGIDVPVPCARCDNPFVRKHTAQRFCSARCAAKPPIGRNPRPCLHCQAIFAPIHGQQVLCGETCARGRHRPKGGRKDRHRARKAGVEYEWINRAKLYERDGWSCQVCGAKTPKHLRGKLVDRAPELDHRIPLAQGGSHTWENVQLACRKCNAEKGAQRIVGQMPLFARPLAA